MNISHNTAFGTIMNGKSERLDEDTQQELEDHLEVCPECRSSANLARRLEETGNSFPEFERHGSKTDRQIVQEILLRKRRLQTVNTLQHGFTWVLIAVLIVSFMGWSIDYLRPAKTTSLSSVINIITGEIAPATSSTSSGPTVSIGTGFNLADPNVLIGIVILLIGLLPLLFIGSVGILMGLRKSSTGWLVFLLMVFGLVVGYLLWSITQMNHGFGGYTLLAIPAWVTIAALLFLHLWETRASLSPISMLLLFVYAAGLAALILGPWYTPQLQEAFPRTNYLMILALSLVPVISWLAWQAKGVWRGLVFIFMFVIAAGLAASFFYFPPVSGYNYRLLINLTSFSSVISPLIIIPSVARLGLSWKPDSKPGQRARFLLRAVAASLLFAILYATIRLQSIRGSLSEEQIIGLVFLFCVLAAMIFAVVAISWKITGKWLAAILAFVLIFSIALVPAVIVPSGSANRLTEQQAGQLNQAILRYHAQTNRYPTELSELTPDFLLLIPEPLTYWSQVWCYDGDAQYYRLGYYYNDTFPTGPNDVSVKIFASGGEIPAQPAPCEVDLATGVRRP